MIGRALAPLQSVVTPAVAPVLRPVVGVVTNGPTTVHVLARSGILRPLPPTRLVTLGKVLAAWGTGPAGAFHARAALEPERVAVVDERGSVTYGELHRRANALARGLGDLGVGEGDTVGLLCRNHRGFVEGLLAASRLGADVLLLNTAFAGAHLREVLVDASPRVVVHDEEFEEALAETDVDARVLAWTGSGADSDRAAGETVTIETLVAAHPGADLSPPSRQARVVILTSGTTGTPRGASRGNAGIGSAVSLLSRIPLRHGWRVHVAAPLFHTWGFAHLMLAVLMGHTVVLRRRFDPAGCLDATETERCQALVVIPVMLQRMLALPETQREQADLSRVEVVATSGSALPGDLALSWMDAFGDHLYNLYGSTEVAYASIATPADLRAAPGSAGRPPHGTVVRILDDDGLPVPAGRSGRIFVGNEMLFEGYTDGSGKEVVDGLMATGDVGRFDASGLLHVEGRDDEMIVSGGENVFPAEVESCLARHSGVREVAAVGVPDAEFGQRLRAYVVAEGQAPTADELREWVRDHLARYAVPRDVLFVDELPRTETGKILKRNLTEAS